MQKDALFVYFCGTSEATAKHLTRFMMDVDAGTHLYISGVASEPTSFEDLAGPLLKELQARQAAHEMPIDNKDIQSFYKSSFFPYVTNRIASPKAKKIAGANNTKECSFDLKINPHERRIWDHEVWSAKPAEEAERKKRIEDLVPAQDGAKSRRIYTIEKVYAGAFGRGKLLGGTTSGYSDDDVKKVVAYSLDKILSILSVHKEIKRVVLSGHSRGAAVGLSSFLYYLLDSLDKEWSGTKVTVRELLAALETIDILFLDPVAGQRGSSNYYRMKHKKDWTTPRLYAALEEKLANLRSISEVYANAAPMIGKLAYGLRTFNPSKSFLEDSQMAKGKLFKLFLGYSHSAMVDEADGKSLPHVYHRLNAVKDDAKGLIELKKKMGVTDVRTPYKLIVDYINSYSLYDPGENGAGARKRYEKYYKKFADSDALFLNIIGQYKKPDAQTAKLTVEGEEKSLYQQLHSLVPESEIVSYVLRYMALRKQARFTNRAGKSVSLEVLVTENAGRFGVLDEGVIRREALVKSFADSEEVSAELVTVVAEAERHDKVTTKLEQGQQKNVKTKDDDSGDDDNGDDDDDDDDDDDSERDKVEGRRAKHAKQRREAIKALLKETGGNIPDLYNEVSKELRKQMQVDSTIAFDPPGYVKFEENVFRTPDLASAKLAKTSDFYSLSVAEQKLLYERVGLFKGIIVDHSKETPLEQGFRDILKTEKGSGTGQNEVVRVFYKRPRLSGYFESTYAFDEADRKTQEIGVFNLGFGLAVNYSSFKTGVGVRAGFSYGKQRMEQRSTHTKRMAVTSSFFLPKIDVSFDATRPCASDAFVEAVKSAVKTIEGQEPAFLRLCKVLRNYGHFVPTNLVIGGRLYSTDTKDIVDKTDVTNTLTEYTAKLQIAVETMTTDVGIEAETTHQTSNKTADKEKRENQRLQLTAVGGEGAYVNNTKEWVESVAPFSAWGLVRFDGLVPSIQLLPADLQKECGKVISDYIETSTIEDLLAVNAHFLFYSGYMEDFGRKVRPKFFHIQHVSSGNVLSVENDRMANSAPVVLRPIDHSDAQQWWYTQTGKVVNKLGYNTDDEYVLTIQDNALVITQNNHFPYQYWDVGGGFIRNKEIEQCLQILSAGKADEKAALTQMPDLAKMDASKAALSGWRFVRPGQLNPPKSIVEKTAPVLAENGVSVLKDNMYVSNERSMSSPDGKVKLVLKDQGVEISYYGSDGHLWLREPSKPTKLLLADGKLTVTSASGAVTTLYEELLRPAHSLELLDNGNLELLDINKNVIWQSESIIYSVIKLETGGGVLSVYHTDYAPTLDRDTVQVMLMPFVHADHQLWYINRAGQLISKLKQNGTIECALSCDTSGRLTLKKVTDNEPEQRWNVAESGIGAIVNRHHGYKLASDDFGKPLKATSGAVGSWRIALDVSSYGKPARLMSLRKPVVAHTEGTSYEDYSRKRGGKSDSSGFAHLGHFEIGAQLCGLQFYSFENRVAVRGRYREGNTVKSVESKDFGSSNYVTKELKGFYLDKAPIYLPKAKGFTLGFAEKGNRIAFFAQDAAGNVYKNHDWSEESYMTMYDKFGFMELSAVDVDDKEVVVGIGISENHGNRFSPYVLTLPKA